MTSPASEYHDIQAIVRTGFGRLEEAIFVLLRITDAVAARAWLAGVAGAPAARSMSYRVTTAGDLKSYQDRVLQVAVSAQGLRALDVPDDIVRGFSREFYLGEVGEDAEREGRTRRLGDTGQNAPSWWDWGRRDDLPDLLVMLYAEAGRLSPFSEMVLADLAAGFRVIRVLDTATVPADSSVRREPFGFVDGISQPDVDWDASRQPGTAADIEYGNTISAGEFLLGYVNEYGFYTQRPLLNGDQDSGNLLPAADDAPSKRDLGRNGSYLVFRQLEQDVAGFWRFVAARSPTDRGVSLAEAMVGRRLATGDPIAAGSTAEIRGVGPEADDIRQNGFTFDGDPEGLTCPFGAHIRRTNPRTGDLPGGKQSLLSRLRRILALNRAGPRDDVISSSRFHRILRRGRPYGTLTDPQTALASGTPPANTGLYFIALNANIARQFEFIQNAWVVNSHFNGLDGESDPLLGNRAPTPLGGPTDGFGMPQPSGCTRRIDALPQFVTVKGSAYFFLPGISALRFVASQGGKG